jgi:hypothetical protein
MNLITRFLELRSSVQAADLPAFDGYFMGYLNVPRDKWERALESAKAFAEGLNR